MNRKVTVVGGAGNVGATVARAIADQELADVVIIDIADQKAAGVALDMLEACPIEGSDSRVVGYGATEEGWKQTANSDGVVITSGVPRKPGMSRDDLIGINTKVVGEVGAAIKANAPNAFVITITNPLDAMVWVMKEATGFPSHRVVGMAGVLDSARFRTDRVRRKHTPQTIVEFGETQRFVQLSRELPLELNLNPRRRGAGQKQDRKLQQAIVHSHAGHEFG